MSRPYQVVVHRADTVKDRRIDGLSFDGLQRPLIGGTDICRDSWIFEQIGGFENVMAQFRTQEFIDVVSCSRCVLRPVKAKIVAELLDQDTPIFQEVYIRDERTPDRSAVAFCGQKMSQP